MKRVGFVIAILSIGFFIWANQELSAPVSSEQRSEASPRESLEKQETIKKMAVFLEENASHSVVAPEPRETEVLGFRVSKSFLGELDRPEGLQSFKNQFHSNYEQMRQDLKQAWTSVDQNDYLKREALITLSEGLIKSGDSPDEHQAQFIKEVEVFKDRHNPNHNLDYAGHALQAYLNHEKNDESLDENLKKLGVPRIVIDPSRLPASVQGREQR